MSSAGEEEGEYEIHNSTAITRAFLQLQQQATREGRGQELLQAARRVAERLRRKPLELGEPLYRLPVLRMQVRCVALRPLYLDFAVCEDRPLVIIKAVRLFSAQES